MTKIKTTKKGMAKKTLSMSLVLAMLATSNVPVWAADFSDGTDTAVEAEAEAPVVDATEEFSDDAAAEAEAPVAEETAEAEAPVVEDTNAEAATEAETNIDGYISTLKVNMNEKGWGNEVTVSGTLTDKNGNVVRTRDYNDANQNIQVSYIWLADGREANNSDSSDVLPSSAVVEDIEYTPSRDDFNKNLSLMVTVKRGNTVIYRETVAGGTVGARDVSNEPLSSPWHYLQNELKGIDTEVTYNGKEQKLVPTNTYGKTESGKNLADYITWNYKEKTNDFTNVTGENIEVTGTLEGTYDSNSEMYGYKATTKSATYKIVPLEITSDNLVASMKTTSVEFTGADQKFGKSDITLEVKVDDTTKLDISDAIKNDAVFTGDAQVGKHKLPGISTEELDSTKLTKNFDIKNKVIKETENTYEIVARNLFNCTAVSDIEMNVDNLKSIFGDQGTDAQLENLVNEIKNGTYGTVNFTGKDGRTFTLANIKGDVTITVEQSLVDAVRKGSKGTINNALTISYKADTKNVTGKISIPVRLTVKNLADLKVSVNGTELATNPSAPTNLGLPYIGKAYDITAAKYGINKFEIKGIDNLQSNEYKITYSDNVNAGTVKVTVTGLLSYEGSVKNFYFTINPVNVEAKSVSMKSSVTVNSANDADASLYKDALEVAIKQELNDKTSVSVGTETLTQDKDYTVKYYYTKGDKTTTGGAATADEVKAIKADGDNVAGDNNYVTAVITVKKGNYNKATFIKSAEITKKKISNVTISLDKTSYTYTGKQIVPEIVVKDGSSVLEKGVDYSVLVKDNINVGTATVTVKALAGSDYEVDSTAVATFEITAAKAEDVVVTLTKSASAAEEDDNTFAYNKGKQVKPAIESITLDGFDVTDQFDVAHAVYGDNNQAGKEMGTVTVSPKAGNKNFTGTKTHKFDIKGTELTGSLKVYNADKKELRPSNIEDDNVRVHNLKEISWDKYHFYYNGDAHTFADAAFISDLDAAKEDTDYEIKYINNVDAGYGFVAVVAKGNYEGDASWEYSSYRGDSYNSGYYNFNGYTLVDGKLMYGSTVVESNIVDIVAFRIESTKFTAKNITVTNGVYASGLPVTPQVTVTVNGNTLVEGKDYTLSIRPQNSDTGFSYPSSVINATNGKPFYVDVISMGGYEFDDIDGSYTFAWGIDKFDFANADVQVSGDNVTVKNGIMTVNPDDYTVTRDAEAGTVTIAAKEGSKNYTGSKTVKAEAEAENPATPVIASATVSGNKATVTLEGEADGAIAYDYVIGASADCIETEEYVAESYGQVETSVTFSDLAQGTYYAYCRAWKRDDAGKKVYSEWSAMYPISIKVITPETPVITKTSTYTKNGKKYLSVEYTACADAENYAVVIGTDAKKSDGQLRPVEVKYTKNNIKASKVTTTFLVEGDKTYYVGMRAYNKTGENGRKVYSKWSNIKTQEVK